MKKKNFKIRRIFTAIISAALVLASVSNVFAAPNSIQLGYANKKPKTYIGGVSFYYKVTRDGKYVYCVEMNKKLAKNVRANLVSNSNKADAGVTYILKNGYPNKSITGNSDKDYYITQTAVWWYLDMVHGTSNLGEQFKKNGSDDYNMRRFVKKLANDGYAHRNDRNTEDIKFALTTANTNMTLNGDYYISDGIKVTSGSGDYKISLTNAPTGTKIVRANGVENVYNSEFAVKVGEVFRVKVPTTSINSTDIDIKVNATGLQSVEYKAYEYNPTDPDMQNVVTLEKTNKNGTVAINLAIDSSQVAITKIDYNTKAAIAGAKLILKDATGKEITSWTSTINAHIIRNLPKGDYTIEEVEAPTGYLLNKNVTKFTVDDTNRSYKINIENAPKKVVVNITKVDQETNAPLAGAVLVVKDSTGREVARFTTTESAYVLTDLENGTYTVEEVSAPAGYLASTEKMTFTIDDEHLSHQITFVNAKAVVVPDTASVSDILLIILGMITLGSGIYYIYQNAKAY